MVRSRSDFEAIAASASLGPWTVREEPGRDSRRVHDGRHGIVERGLSAAVAHYLVTLRNVTDAIAGPRLSRADRARLRDALRTTMRDAGATWIFTAPTGDGERYFLHDCIRRLGSAGLSRADALFVDAAKTALPMILGLTSPMPAERGATPLFIPKRMVAPDATAEYAGFAFADQPLHALSGRNEVTERTEAMITAILRRLDIPPGSRVLDIGCGDATLLRRIATGTTRAVGTVLTEAERRKLAGEPTLAGFEFATASFETLDELTGPFDRIIANGCLHFVRTAVGADRTLAKLAKLLVPGGRIWAGELHATDCRRVAFTSKRAALRHARDAHGRAFALAFARHLWRHRRRAGVIVARPPIEWWHVTPEGMAAIAARHGLAVAGTWSCLELTGDTFYALQNRFSCLLVKS